MLQTTTLTSANKSLVPALNSVFVERLVTGQESEVLEFLSQRPIHTVAMLSLIRDNGLTSPLNRGIFYSCRDINGHIEGVALVGHATLMETVSDRALRKLAEVAQACPYTHMIMGEETQVADFWTHYSEAGRKRRLACRELLFELRSPSETNNLPASLRLATEDELELVMPVQAQLALEESGIDPLKVDPEGFRERCLRRIELGRTWVLVENASLVFKADVIAQTAEVIYLEGIWIDENRRNDGSAVRCMSQLSQQLLEEAKSICLLVNENNQRAQAFYRKCGFLFRATYETIFLPRKEYFRQITQAFSSTSALNKGNRFTSP
jgi:ribosomal protein S18 acetylase RimI-like enzyme